MTSSTIGTIFRRNLTDTMVRFLGNWNATTIYIPGDGVAIASGDTYVCTAQNSNQQPPNATYWTKIGISSVDLSGYIAKPAAPSSNDVLMWNGTTWTNGKIGDANVSSISLSKLGGYPADGTKFAAGDGTWKTIAAPGTILDYGQNTTLNIAGGTATTEATGQAIVSGNAVTYDGTAVWIEVFVPYGKPAESQGDDISFTLWIDSTSLGTIAYNLSRGSGSMVLTAFGKRKYTPSVGSHTFSVTAWGNVTNWYAKSGAGTSGTLAPAYISVTKA